MRFRVGLLLCVVLLCGALSAEEGGEQRYLDRRSASVVSAPPGFRGDTTGNSNFTDLFIASLQSFSASGGQAVTFDYNFPDGIFGKGLASKARVALQKPDLNSKFRAHLGADTAAISRFGDELGIGDDVTLTFAVSPRAKSKQLAIRDVFAANDRALFIAEWNAGRTEDFAQSSANIRALALTGADDAQRFDFLDAIFRGEIADAARIKTTEARVNATAARSAAMAARGIAPLDDPKAQAAAADAEEKAAKAEADAESAAKIERSLREEMPAVAEELVRKVGNLAANQSKFNLAASYRKQREAAGPNEWFVETSYEYGIDADAAEKPTALLKAANDSTVAMGSRLTFALQYHNYSSVNIAAHAFKLPGSKSLVASVVGGRDVFANKEAKDRSGRIELSMAYDDVSGDKDRKDRLIAKLTYFQRINEDFYFPVSLVYANHDDYLSNVDRKLNAHFGIGYKLQDKPKKQ